MRLSGLEHLILFMSAGLISLLLNPLFRKLALAKNILDTPNTERKIQRTAIPYLGGFSIIISVFVVVSIALITHSANSQIFYRAAYVLIPALLLGLVGYIDDVKHLGAGPRFLAQFLAGVFTAVILVGSQTVGTSFNNKFLDAFLTILWVVGIANAINFLDNMDGAASGVAAISAFGFFLVATQSGQFLVAALGLVLSGACLGYLKLNWHPAKIYMGDSGALFIGVLLAALAVRLDPKEVEQPISFFIPVLLLAIPILDTSLVVIDRLRRRANPFEGGLDHISHRLRRHGLSVRQSVGVIYLIQLVCVFLALYISAPGNSLDTFLGIASMVSAIALFLFFIKTPAEGSF
jgi:UDP-GlcNAc:undecaprenyl-phosphate/decaprenyl-phosphate GlcNAc-1-phosphate transferase